MTKRLLIVSLLFCSLAAPAFSVQPAQAQPQRFAFEHLSAEDGLPDNLVWAIHQDRLGFLWIATGNGLVKYDGYNMTLYPLRAVVTAIHEDTKGQLWFGSFYGLLRFDRETETFYGISPDPDDATALSAPWVRFIHEDRQGYLWLITSVHTGEHLAEETFLDRFDTHDSRLYADEPEPLPPSGYVTRYRHDPDDRTSLGPGMIPDNRTGPGDMARFAFYEDRQGTIWIGTQGGGLNRYDPDTDGFIHYRHDPNDPASLSHDHVTSIVEDAAGRLWVGTDGGGLNLLNRATGRFAHVRHDPDHAAGLSDDRVLHLYADSLGRLWITTPSTLHRYDPDVDAFMPYPHHPSDLYGPGPGPSPSFVALEEEDGNLWLVSGTSWNSYSLDYYDRRRDTFTRYWHDSDDPGTLRIMTGILGVLRDRAGTLWVGTFEGGVNTLSRSVQKFRTYRHDPADAGSISRNYVMAIYEDRDGVLWTGTPDGLSRLRSDESGGRFMHYRHVPADPTSLSVNAISTIHEDREGALWVGTSGGGINRFDAETETFTHYRHDPGDPASLSDDRVSSALEDHEGTLWVATRDGLNRFDAETETFTRYRHDPGDSTSLCWDEIHVISEDRAGTLWVGTNTGGVCRFDRAKNAFTHVPLVRPRFETIIDLYEDQAGRFWVGTHGLGLFLLDRATGAVTRYTEQEGLSHNKIKSILEDEAGHLWLGTERGLAWFDPTTEAFRTYDLDDGLPSQFFTGPNVAWQSATGRLFFGTDSGLLAFDPEYVVQADNPHPPQVALTGVKIFNEPVYSGGYSPLQIHINVASGITLSHRQNDISIDYAALHFSKPENNTYAYKLENYEEAWREVGTQHTATYTSLDAGEYVFRVKAANSDGVWNEEGASLRIIVLPPFWQTLWFRSSILVIVLLAAFGGYRRRVSKLEKKRTELEARVKERTEAAAALQQALSEVERLKNRLEAENTYLQDEIKIQHNFENIITRSEALKRVLRSVEQVAATDATVLITGESGTGKELLARAVHNISPRRDRPLVKVNCAALPTELIESELFGHEKGAFTGAVARKIGRFELADGGTIFLDEIGDLALELQAKLLRVLQEGEFERLGNPKTISVDVRVIAATNRDLENAVANGEFREDLYYRLNVFPIESPPLRARKEDIPLLVSHFVKKYSKKIGKPVEAVPQSVVETLQRYHWPGNVRELENIIERAVILSPEKKLVLGDWLPKTAPASNGTPLCTLEENERDHITKALALTGGRVSGEQGAAKLLGINPHTLTSRMKKLGIQRK